MNPKRAMKLIPPSYVNEPAKARPVIISDGRLKDGMGIFSGDS